jgi:hypothetical protein
LGIKANAPLARASSFASASRLPEMRIAGGGAMQGTQVLEEQDGVREVDTPCRRIRTGPHGPRDVETQNQNEVNRPTLEHGQRIVAALDRIDFVAVVVMKVVGEHLGHGRIATD